MSDIFREVDEEIRKEDYAALARKYGPWVIGLAVAIVLLVAGYQGWQYYDREQRLERSQAFTAALRQLDDGDTAAARSALAGLADPEGDGFALLAALELARIQAEAGETASALEIWERIAASANADRPLRAAATVFAVMHRMDEGDPAALAERLQPYAGQDGAFRFSALELQALLARRQGDGARARELYRQIADAPAAPQGLRQRATQMLKLLEG